MITRLTISVGVLSMFSSQPRITERALADVAAISIPSNVKTENEGRYNDEEIGRLTFGFSSTYFWASMGSITTYRQLLVVSVMAPDASDAEYATVPRRMGISYEQRTRVQSRTIGTGTLTVTEGIYTRGSVTEPAHQFLYSDRARRLQLVWHAVKQDVDLATGITQVGRIASSFRMVRDPVTKFAAMRAAPLEDAEARAGKLATVQAMLKREGYTTLQPGKPVLRDGVYLEWMADPEPRYQLLVSLGRVPAAANGSVVDRPRPTHREGNAARPSMAGTLGWREVVDGDWTFGNQDNDYLPLPGIGAALAAQQQDRGFVYFYYVATVRVEEENDDSVLTSLRWFLDGLPDVRRRWQEGALVSPGKPQDD